MTELIDSPEVDPGAPRADRPTPLRIAGPIISVVAAGMAVGLGRLVAAMFTTVSPLNAVGSEFIDHTPKWLKTWAIDQFGTRDKDALRIGMVVVIAIAALIAGTQLRRRPAITYATFFGFGLLGTVVALRRPATSWTAAVPVVIGTVAALTLLIVGRGQLGLTAIRVPGLQRRPGSDRRAFITTTAGAAAVAGLAAITGRRIEQQQLDTQTATTPTLTVKDVAIPASADVVDGTPFITPNERFYLIDTALSVPRVALNRWRVTVNGMVDTPLSLSYDDLINMPQVAAPITIACVSNEVGGSLIGTAVWQGVRLADVLNAAGVAAEAEQVFSTSLDGWTCGFPVELALDGRDALIALTMNGEPLPPRHGYPARLIVPGIYGYVSATKWLGNIKLTTWADDVGYWVPKGWARLGPIKTQSRIDLPRRTDQVIAGPVAIAGVAWAQHRGVSRVEVGIDGEWFDATLATDVSVDTWRQWTYAWDATPGEHVIQVRATDTTGTTQTDEVAPPDPDGATGYHTRRVTVT